MSSLRAGFRRLATPLLASLLCALTLPFLASCRSEPSCSSWQDVSAALSPDGSTVACLGRRGQPADSPICLMTQSLGDAKSSRILASDVSPVMPPAFTPDGKGVLYLRRGLLHMVLMRVSLEGGEPQEMASFRVSPQHLDCLRSDSSLVFVSFMEGYFGTSSSISVYDLNSGAISKFNELPVATVESAAISGDGRTMLICDGRSLWSLNPSSPDSPAQDITLRIKPFDRPVQFALSQDGSMLCLRLGRLSNRDVGNASGDVPAAKPELSKIKYQAVDQRRLVLLELNGLAEPKTIAEGAAFICPAFSPDSKRIAFIQGPKLCVYSLDRASTAYLVCQRFEYGEFLAWFGNSSLVCRELGAPYADARLLLVPADCKKAPKELIAVESATMP